MKKRLKRLYELVVVVGALFGVPVIASIIAETIANWILGVM